MRREIAWAQEMLIFGTVGLVATFLVSGMLAPGWQASGKSSAEPSM